MFRNESRFALQLLPLAGHDLYRAFLTGGWLTSETDVQSPRLEDPGGAGKHEVHAPAITATSQLGFDLWVAATHRAGRSCPPPTLRLSSPAGRESIEELWLNSASQN